MNNKKQSTPRLRAPKVSFVALIFALLACIATFFLGIMRGLYSMELFTGLEKDDLNRYLIISAGLIVLGIAAYTVMEPDRVRRFFTGRQARYGSNTVIMSFALLGILIVGNVLAYQLTDQYSELTFDLTEDNSNTLAPELVTALETLPEKVTATAFFTADSNRQNAEELLSKIQAGSRGKFEYSFVDPDRDPQTAFEAGITGNGKILLQMGKQQEIVAFASEEEILKGLSRLLNPGNNVVYFLTGHGELDTEQAGDTSMTRAKETLESKNYTVKTLNLLSEKQVPEDATVIIIAGPIKPVSEDEVQRLNDYLAKSGALLVMENPVALTNFGDAPDPLAEMLTEDWGITLNNDIVVDLDSPDLAVAAAAFYDSQHPITIKTNRVGAYFPYTRSLSVAESMENVTLTRLVQTNQRSWGETDAESLRTGQEFNFNEGEAVGPLTLAVAGVNSETQSRVVVFGTANVAVDQIFDTLGNGDLFVNSVDWAAEEEQSIGITPKPTTPRMFKPPEQFQRLAIWLGSIIMIPGLVVVWGISTWIARRRQG